jgi:hypothetical protein
MKYRSKRDIGYLACLVVLSFPVAGCGADPEDVGDPVVSESPSNETTLEATRAERAWWRWHRRNRPPDQGGGAVGGAAGQGGMAGSGGDGGNGGSAGTDIGGAGGTIGGVGGTTGGSAGAPGSGTASDCGLCAKAQECCMVVSGGPLCQYSASTCSSKSGVTRTAYVDGCRVMLTTTSAAWKGQPPSACR